MEQKRIERHIEKKSKIREELEQIFSKSMKVLKVILIIHLIKDFYKKKDITIIKEEMTMRWQALILKKV
jgi:hypothetical protein